MFAGLLGSIVLAALVLFLVNSIEKRRALRRDREEQQARIRYLNSLGSCRLCGTTEPLRDDGTCRVCFPEELDNG